MNKLTLTLALLTAPALSANAATKYEQAEIEKEVASCVAEVADHADYRDAGQIRHEIEVTDRRTIGHKLNIRTSVYSETGERVIREYATRCIVYRDNKPVRFEISEVRDDA